MTATFNCPKCGRHGSIKKEIPRGAKIRCPGCQTVITSDFAKEPAPDTGVSESVIRQFLGPPISNPLPDLPVQDDEPMGASTRPQRSSPAAQPPSLSHEKPTKYCHYCGSIIALLAEICPKCGVRQTEPVVSLSKRDSPNKVIAFLLAFFLGLFGAHKFYLGQPKRGTIYACVNVFWCWTLVVPLVFGVICLIEGCGYLAQSDSDFAQRYGQRHDSEKQMFSWFTVSFICSAIAFVGSLFVLSFLIATSRL